MPPQSPSPSGVAATYWLAGRRCARSGFVRYRPGRAASQILADWSREVSPERARAVLIWLIERKILLISRP